MADYIERQAAIDTLIALTVYKTMGEISEQINRSMTVQNGWLGGIADCINEIEDMPEAPVLTSPILLCQECMHWDKEPPIDDGRRWCVLHGGFMYYCSDAEREKEDKHD